jgi:hypothetical protein
MARRRKPTADVATRRVVTGNQSSVPDMKSLNLPNIEAFISDGQITLGKLHPLKGVAIASDQHGTVAMLKRGPGESVIDLLVRLDAAIEQATAQNLCIDEINS